MQIHLFDGEIWVVLPAMPGSSCTCCLCPNLFLKPTLFRAATALLTPPGATSCWTSGSSTSVPSNFDRRKLLQEINGVSLKLTGGKLLSQKAQKNDDKK